MAPGVTDEDLSSCLPVETVEVVKGIDVDKLRSLLGRLAQETADAATQGAIDDKVGRLRDELNPQIDALAERVSSLEGQLQSSPKASDLEALSQRVEALENSHPADDLKRKADELDSSVQEAKDLGNKANEAAEEAKALAQAEQGVKDEVDGLKRDVDHLKALAQPSSQQPSSLGDSGAYGEQPAVQQSYEEAGEQPGQEGAAQAAPGDDGGESGQGGGLGPADGAGLDDLEKRLAELEKGGGNAGEQLKNLEGRVAELEQPYLEPRVKSLEETIPVLQASGAENLGGAGLLGQEGETGAPGEGGLHVEHTGEEEGPIDAGEEGQDLKQRMQKNEDRADRLNKGLLDLRKRMQDTAPRQLEDRINEVEDKLASLPAQQQSEPAEGEAGSGEGADGGISELGPLKSRVENVEQRINTKADRTELDALARSRPRQKSVAGGEQPQRTGAEEGEEQPSSTAEAAGSGVEERADTSEDKAQGMVNRIDGLEARLDLFEARAGNVPTQEDMDSLRDKLNAISLELSGNQRGSLASRLLQLEGMQDRLASLQSQVRQLQGSEATGGSAKALPESGELGNLSAKLEELWRQLEEQGRQAMEAIAGKADKRDLSRLEDELANAPVARRSPAHPSETAEGGEDGQAEGTGTAEAQDAQVVPRLEALEGRHNKLRRAHDDLTDQVDKLAARMQSHYLHTSRALDDLAKQAQGPAKEEANNEQKGTQSADADKPTWEAAEALALAVSTLAVGQAWRESDGEGGLHMKPGDNAGGGNRAMAPGHEEAQMQVMRAAEALPPGSTTAHVARLLRNGDVRRKQDAGLGEQQSEGHGLRGQGSQAQGKGDLEDRVTSLEKRQPPRVASDLNRLSNRLKRLESAVQQRPDSDHAILSSKPLFGYRCMSCDQSLHQLNPDPGSHVPPPSFSSVPRSHAPPSQSRPDTSRSASLASGPHLPPGGYRSTSYTAHPQQQSPPPSSQSHQPQRITFPADSPPQLEASSMENV